MGNLCSSGADGSSTNKSSAHQQQYAAGTPPNKPAASQPGPSSKGQPADPIDAALADAKKELEKNKGQDFHNKYKVSKLVGHGAFAKVMICSHVDTNEKFAVKTVQKNLEDPQKQREGERTACTGDGPANTTAPAAPAAGYAANT
jgi:calcium-dependent protein kinase